MALPALPKNAIDVTVYFDGTDPAKAAKFTNKTGLRCAFRGEGVAQAHKAGGPALAMAYVDKDGTLYSLHTVQGETVWTGPNSFRAEKRFEMRPLGKSI